RSLCAANRYEVAFLPTAGSSYTEATGLNNSNQVVGVSGMASNEFFPVLWENGLLKDLSGFTFPNGQDLSFARPAAVNDAGQIIGIKAVLPNTVSWILSNGNLAIIDGPSLYSRPLALNEHGIVVGDSRVSAEFDSISRAALFGTNAKLFDETVPLTIYSSEAIGINESGTVLSRAYIRNDFGGTDVHTHICSTTENFAQGTVLTNFSASAIND